MQRLTIKPVDVVHGTDVYIRSFAERILKRCLKSNINILVNGQPATGKSNVAYQKAYELSKKLDRELKIVFEFDEFRRLILNDKLREFIIIYDEVNSSYENWFDEVYQLLARIFDRFAFRKLILFIIAPRYKSVYGLRDYCQFEIFTDLEFNPLLEDDEYVAYFSILKINRKTKEIMAMPFGLEYPKKCNSDIWEIGSELKEKSYQKFLKNKVNKFEKFVGYKHSHKWIHSARKETMRCERCPTIVSDTEWKVKYGVSG